MLTLAGLDVEGPICVVSGMNAADEYARIFDADVLLLQKWLTNRGRIICDDFVGAAVRVIVGVTVASQIPLLQSNVPYIVVHSEQTQHPIMGRADWIAYLQQAHAVWCMDLPDYLLLHRAFGIPESKLCIVPTLLGAYFYPPANDTRVTIPPAAVLQFGAACDRRVTVSADAETRLQAINPDVHSVLLCGVFPGPDLERAIAAARVVMVANCYPEPCVYTVHRLAYVLRHIGEHGCIVVETCPASKYCGLLIDALVTIGVVRIAPYGSLASAAVEAATTPRSFDRAPLEALMQRVQAWDGKTPWTDAWLGVPDPGFVGQVPRVCAAMIVKDEEAILERALRSLWPFIDAYCILDTGSSDDTRGVVTRFAARMPKPGIFVQGQWKGFGPSRSEALSLARAMLQPFEWLVMMDADDVFVGAPGTYLDPTPPSCKGVALTAKFGNGGSSSVRPHVFARSAPWVYRGVLHEYACLESGVNSFGAPVPASAFYIDARTEGVRSRNPQKYADDAAILEREYAAHPTDYRALFYLAQSWRDAGDVPKALQRYKEMAHQEAAWIQERYVSCVQICDLSECIEDAMPYAWLAAKLLPRRRDATFVILERVRKASDWRPDAFALGLLALEQGSAEALPDFLFVRTAAYSWRFYDELGVVAFWHGAMALCVRLSKIARVDADAGQHARIDGNIAAAKARLAQVPA